MIPLRRPNAYYCPRCKRYTHDDEWFRVILRAPVLARGADTVAGYVETLKHRACMTVVDFAVR